MPRKKKTKTKHDHVDFDKYDLYHRAVQSSDEDVLFLQNAYKELKGKKAKVLREDFCGTFAMSCEWVKLNPAHVAYGVDIDPEPMTYGKNRYFKKLTPGQQKRVHCYEKNVLEGDLPKADIAVAMNFSYFVFKKREIMKKYFLNAYKSLKPGGVFFLDAFGGIQCQDEIEDEHRFKNFSYFWDQTGFDPITNEALFYIHFKVNGKKIEKVFTYDWRLWTIPELREILAEVGFKKTHVYWEGTNKKGEGNGYFTRTEKGEPCESWIAYIVSEK